LLDFGIAKLLQPPQHTHPGSGATTREIGQALTPEFAAPEQLLGQPVTTATDVYSLGVVLYLLLAGRHPRGEGKVTRTQWVKSITEEPPRPSELATDTRHLTVTDVATNAGNRGASASSLRRALRGDLDNILCKALKPEPEQRYSTVTELAADLRRYLRSEPVIARPDTIAYRAQKFVRRNRGGVAAGLLMLVTLVGATVVTALQMLEARRQRDAALYQQQRAEQVKDFITSIFADASPWSGPQDKPSAVELLTRARARVDDIQGFDPATRFELLSVIGESLHGLGATTEAAQTADSLVAQSAAQLGDEHPLTLRGRSLRAHALRGQGQTEAMRREVEAVLVLLRPRADAQPEATVKALNDL
ncbi:MAG: serine/threonine protein kinase, partial [Steroidobacteraceae bacterium]